MNKSSAETIKIVFDTNLYIAAFLKTSLADFLLRFATEGRLEIYLCEEILEEIGRKLLSGAPRAQPVAPLVWRSQTRETTSAEAHQESFDRLRITLPAFIHPAQRGWLSAEAGKPETEKNRLETFLSHIKRISRVISIEEYRDLKVVAADPDDDKIIACALATQAHLVVTLDHHLLKLKNYQGTVIVHPKTLTWMIPDY